MKGHLRFILPFICFYLGILTGCSDEEGPKKGMNANINGDEWKTISRVTVLENGKFVITGSSLSGETLVITIFGDSPGDYELSVTSAKCGAIYKKSVNTSTEDAYISTSGFVQLSEVDKTNNKISGSFSFSMRKDLTGDVIEIDHGVFNNLLYTEPGNI